MKKIISVLILMVMVIMLGSTAVAETKNGIIYGITTEEAKNIIDEFIEKRGLWDWQIFNAVESVLYGYGGICKEDFEAETNKPFSKESFEEWSIDKFDICEIHTYVIETVDGITFYRSQAQSETTPLGYKDGEAYYCADVIFFVFSTYDYEE